MLQKTILTAWEKRGLLALVLSPLGMLVCVAAYIKRLAYESGWLKQTHLSVPVIVVGNIHIGGTGKSPLLAYIVKRLQAASYKPGIICRGYKGEADTWPQAVDEHSDATWLGDEAVMLAKQCRCPVMAGPDKPAAAQHLLETSDCDIIVSDDGFGHLKLARDIDIVLLKAKQQGSPHGKQEGQTQEPPHSKITLTGNGWCLPAGPLRESISALKAADILVSNLALNLSKNNAVIHEMTLRQGDAYSLQDASQKISLEKLKDKTLHAVAGIAQPSKFFDTLEFMGIKYIAHPFMDHQIYTPGMLDFNDDCAIITTEKDAVKFIHKGKALTANRAVYVLPVQAEMPEAFDTALFEILNRLKTNSK